MLAHISSLPDEFGYGNIGSSARAFCDFLSRSGMRAWQILPLNPTGSGGSPYNSFSAFAGNPMLIDLGELIHMGLLSRDELSDCLTLSCSLSKVFFREREKLLRLAFSRFHNRNLLLNFAEQESFWLYDYASFMSIKDELCNANLKDFPEEIRNRQSPSLRRNIMREEEMYYFFEQFVFYTQWSNLREYATSLGIKLIGDMPIYVASDSADVWSSPELFNLDANLHTSELSGCPPDSFSSDGQLWGNPTYNWEEHERQGFSWWISRFSHLARMFDIVRIDHFRGFESYWSVPASAESAKYGRWIKAPGHALFEAVRDKIPSLSIIAEDLGFLTDEVFALRDELNAPGMRVLQFAFNGDTDNMYLPHNYIENCVAYTGTHDNDTSRGWAESAPEHELAFARQYLGFSDTIDASHAFIEGIWNSRAFLAIAPIQDFLNLPSSARMNTPGTVSDKNWSFRIPYGALTDELSDKLSTLNLKSRRI